MSDPDYYHNYYYVPLKYSYGVDSPNIYYAPLEHGLLVVGEVERNYQPHQYHLFVVWQDIRRPLLYYDTEQGCSCPVPFNRKTREHLTPIHTYDYFERALKSFLDGHAADGPPSPDALEQADRLRRVVREKFDRFVDWAYEAAERR